MADSMPSAELNPGPLVKLMYVDDTGELLAPVRGTVYRPPLLSTDSFDASNKATYGSGIHAFRFGHLAAPWYWRVAMAICHIPSGYRAVMSPWAVRAEAILVERLVLHSSILGYDGIYQHVRRTWGPHCDIIVVQPGDYTALIDEVGFLLHYRRILLKANAGEIRLDRPRYLRIDACEGGVVVKRHSLAEPRVLRGAEVLRRVERSVRRWYRRGNVAMRDILTPWLRYFDYLR